MATVTTLHTRDAARLVTVPRRSTTDARLSPRAAVAAWLLFSGTGWGLIASFALALA